jgi:hypothetical protein
MLLLCNNGFVRLARVLLRIGATLTDRGEHKFLNCWRSVHRRHDCEFVDARGADLGTVSRMTEGLNREREMSMS